MQKACYVCNKQVQNVTCHYFLKRYIILTESDKQITKKISQSLIIHRTKLGHTSSQNCEWHFCVKFKITLILLPLPPFLFFPSPNGGAWKRARECGEQYLSRGALGPRTSEKYPRTPARLSGKWREVFLLSSRRNRPSVNARCTSLGRRPWEFVWFITPDRPCL